jgi:hypothetical protein
MPHLAIFSSLVHSVNYLEKSWIYCAKKSLLVQLEDMEPILLGQEGISCF